MPLSRYRIRDEYSLADPELYRAADKDDPEAILEAVAMAGLVGVLRQLGDLAEFAAEIFHDLHEEVMATAARGHGLMDRVQQLEAEFPLIEKAFLSQTSHSSFFYNAGTAWHPNLHMDQNLVTHGDLPRFIMDSYEECRGPPQLFLLDKFDVAGAGSCLKRYTDPSFFRVELLSSRVTSAEAQREKKIRKPKKKGSRWRNGETPDMLSTSHAKLHQLFLEEHVENGASDPGRRVKLKRRLNGFPFDSKSGESYMQKFFNNPSPEQKLVRETYGGSSPLKLPWNVTVDSGLEIHEISTVSSDKESIRGMSSLSSSPNREEIAPSTLGDFFSEDVDTTLSMLHTVVEEKEILVDSGSKVEESLVGYQPDDIAGEMDNFVDALTTMDSEMETEAELRAKNCQVFFNIKKPGTDSDANGEQLHVQFSDSRSIGNSTASDDGISSSKKGIFSSSYSDSPGTSADNVPLYSEFSHKVYPSAEICEAEVIDKSSGHVSFSHGVSLTQPLENGLSADVPSKVAKISSCRDEFSEQFSSSSLADPAPTISHSDLGSTMRKDKLVGEQMEEALSSCDKSNMRSINFLENGTILREYTCNGSNLSDKTHDFPPSVSSESHSLNEIDSEGPNAFSAASIHFLNISDEAYCTESVENSSNNVLKAECLQKHYAENFIQNLISSPHSVISTTERKIFMPALPESESCGQDANDEAIISEADYDVPLNGDMATSLAPLQDIPDTCDLTKSQVSEIVNDDVTLCKGSAEVNDTYSEKQFGTVNVKEVGETIPTIDLVETDVSPNPASLSEFHEVLELEAAVLANVCAFPDDDADSSLNLRKLHASSLGFLDQTKADISEAHFPENFEESSSNEQASPPPVSLNLNSFQCNTVCSGHYESQAHNNIPESNMAPMTKNSLNLGYSILVPSSLDDSDHVPESKSNAQGNSTENAEDVSSLTLNQQVIASPDLNLSDDTLVQSSLEESGQVTDSNTNLPCNATENAEHLSSLVVNQKAVASPDLNPGDAILVTSALENRGQDSESISDQQGNTTENAKDVSSSVLNLQAIASSDLDLFCTVSTGHSELQLLNDIPDSSVAQVGCSESLDDATLVPSSSEDCGHGLQSKCHQGSSAGETIEDASLLASVEPRILVDQKVNLEDDQLVIQASQESSPVENVEDASSLPTPFERSFQLKQKLKLQTGQLDMESPQLVENMGDVSPLPTFADQRISTEKDVILQSELNVKSPYVAETNLESFVHSEHRNFVNHVDPERQIGISSECHPINFPIQFSMPELIPQPSGHKVDTQQYTGPLTSIFPGFGMLSETAQINLDEIPPLPPLPPLQWRMGKLQEAPQPLDGDAVQNQMDSLEHIWPSTLDHKAQNQGEISLPSNPSFLSHLPEKRESSQHSYEMQSDMQHSSHFSLQIPISVNCGHNLGNPCTFDKTHPVNPFSTSPGTFSVMQQHDFHTVEDESLQTSLNPCSSVLAPGNTASTFAIGSSQDKVFQSPHQVEPEASFEAERPVQNSGISEGTGINSCNSIDLSQIIQEGQPLHIFPMLAEESVTSAVDEGNINVSWPTKLPRPRNPLIDAVVAHDKSKLRKVTDRVQPEVPKAEERESLLEQIRAKSFNLKPAAVNRPNIQGPRTNLKVAAILEKANAIRQAFAGSDEDDDHWSDS